MFLKKDATRSGCCTAITKWEKETCKEIGRYPVDG